MEDDCNVVEKDDSHVYDENDVYEEDDVYLGYQIVDDGNSHYCNLVDEDINHLYDCYYIHDMSSTVVKNRELTRYCNQNNLDMSAVPENIRNYMTSILNGSMEVVAIECYECDRVGNVNQERKHLITVIGQTYSHYVRDDKYGNFRMRTDDPDQYDFQTKTFKTHLYRKESFFTEQDSNKRVLELFENNRTVRGNAHKFINEFCFDLYEGFNEKNFKGRLIEKPKGYHHPLLSNLQYIAFETVIFGNAKSLHVIDDSNIGEYSYQHKTLGFDFETVEVDSQGSRIVGDIIQASMVYQEGKKVYRIIGITIGEAVTDSSFYDFSHLTKFCSNDSLPGTEIYCVKDVQQLLEMFIEVIVDVKPDYLLGYNIKGFDIPMMIKSASKSKIELYDCMSQMKYFQRNKYSFEKDLQDYQNRMKSSELSTLEDNKCFEIGYRLFPGLLINDLFRVHEGEKLDTLAKTHLGFGKEDVNYHEIPRLFYSNDRFERSRLLKYNIVDALICTCLINTVDNFQAYSFFNMCTSLFKVPHSEFFDNQKMAMILPILYYAYRRENVLQEMRIKPARENTRLSFIQVVKYYLYDETDVKLSTAKEWIFKFSSGRIKTRTIAKHFDLETKYGQLENVNFEEALRILDEQIANAKEKNKKQGRNYYTLTHLLIFLRFLSESRDMKEFDVRGFIHNYIKVRQLGRYAPVSVKKGSRQTKKNDALAQEEIELVNELILFVKYLSRRFITSSHTVELLVSDYFEFELKNKKFEKPIEEFAFYLNNNAKGLVGKEFLGFVKDCSIVKHGRRFTDRYTSDTFCEEAFLRISNHFLDKFDIPFKYDGAHVHLPNPGIVVDKPVNTADFASMYPSNALEDNMGTDVELTRRNILANNLKVHEDFTVSNVFAQDDNREVTLNVLSNMDDEEAKQCFKFYMTTKHATSILAKTWGEIIRLRLYFKRQIGTFDNERSNQIAEEKSNTFKIVINSIYGVFSLLGQWQISAVITAMGRRHIKAVGRYMVEHRNAFVVYGDTDSVMYHLNMDTTELSAMYDSGMLLTKGWIGKEDCAYIDKFADDVYKKGCIVSSVISKRAVEELNNLHITNSDRAIFKPPSKLEHEKTMLPFIISTQKKYFGKIVDTSKEDYFIIRGLESRKRNRLLATEMLENTMCADLLQRKPSSWKTFQLASQIVSSFMDETIDLKTISSRKKITVTASRLNGKKFDAGVELYKRMKQRGQIIDAGGLDKISIDVVKVLNHEDKSKLKLESLDYLYHLKGENKPLDLDSKAIVKQVLREVISIMTVIHPPSTCKYYDDLLELKLSPDANPTDFEKFVSPLDDIAPKNESESNVKKSLLVKSLYSFFDVTNDTLKPKEPLQKNESQKKKKRKMKVPTEEEDEPKKKIRTIRDFFKR